MGNIKYVWVNPQKGEFTNSWRNSDFLITEKMFSEAELKEAAENGYYLIKYECINKDDFEFYNMMKFR